MIIENVRIYASNQQNRPEDMYHVEIEEGKYKKIQEGKADESDTPSIDGGGRTLVPAFNDSHMHLLRFGLLKKELDLTLTSSWKEMKEEVDKHYAEIEQHDWIYGKGFDDSSFEDIDHLLTAEDLEEIHADKCIFFLHQDGHECVVNEKVLEKIRDKQELKSLPDDFIEKDSDGRWTGRFKDLAVHYINSYFMGRSVSDAKEALLCAFPYLLKYGITSVHTEDVLFVGTYQKLWQAFRELEKEQKLPIKAHLHKYIFSLEDLQAFIEEHQAYLDDETERVRVGAIKIFLDGTQRLHTSAMRNPYPDEPETEGNLMFSQEDLNEMVREAAKHNLQLAMHAIGDRAVEQALNALEQDQAKTSQLRHRIIHAQTLGPDLLTRLEELKPYIETQPSFLMSEWSEKADWSPDEILPYCDAYKSLSNRNIPFTLSSDAPIGELNPFETIFAAVNRTGKDHQPEGGWMPDQKLSLEECFHAYTQVPAELEFLEHKKGKVQEGYAADFLLLEDYPSEVPSKKLREIQVAETWIDGKQVYSKS